MTLGGWNRTLFPVLTEQITSRQNPLIKRAQRIRIGAEPGHMFVEGLRLVEEAVESNVGIEAIVFTSEFQQSDRGGALIDRLAHEQYRGALVPDALMKSICAVESPQGVVALAAHPRFDVDDLFERPKPIAVALETLQDPGNVGTIIRATEAAGGSGVALSSGSAEPYSPKALRSSMGSAFRLPIARRVAPATMIEAAKERGLRVFATAPVGAELYTDIDWTGPSLLVIGNEGAGLSPESLALADTIVTIPLSHPVESLNAALAAAVILFEAMRQRRLEKA